MHAESGARWYFTELGELNDFIRLRLSQGGNYTVITRPFNSKLWALAAAGALFIGTLART